MGESKQDLEEIVKNLTRKEEIKENPFSKLPNEALIEALNLIYEFSEDFDPKI